MTYNAKPKETKEVEAADFNELKKQIYEAFNIEDGKINFMKPRLKVFSTLFRMRRPSRRMSRRVVRSSSWGPRRRRSS